MYDKEVLWNTEAGVPISTDVYFGSRSKPASVANFTFHRARDSLADANLYPITSRKGATAVISKVGDFAAVSIPEDVGSLSLRSMRSIKPSFEILTVEASGKTTTKVSYGTKTFNVVAESDETKLFGITEEFSNNNTRITQLGWTGSIILGGIIVIEEPSSHLISPYGYANPYFSFTVHNTTGLDAHLSTDLNINQGEISFNPPGPLSSETTTVVATLAMYTSNQFTFNVIVSVTDGENTVDVPFSMTCLAFESSANADPHFTPFF